MTLVLVWLASMSERRVLRAFFHVGTPTWFREASMDATRNDVEVDDRRDVTLSQEVVGRPV